MNIPRYVQTVRTDAAGRFTSGTLPAGSYLAAASTARFPETDDPEFLSRLKSGAQQFSLTAGEKKTLTLKIDVSSEWSRGRR